MPVHFYDPHYGRWPCTQAFDCSLPALATAHDAVSQKSADFSHPSSVSSSLTWGTLCCLGVSETFSKEFGKLFPEPPFRLSWRRRVLLCGLFPSHQCQNAPKLHRFVNSGAFFIVRTRLLGRGPPELFSGGLRPAILRCDWWRIWERAGQRTVAPFAVKFVAAARCRIIVGTVLVKPS